MPSSEPKLVQAPPPRRRSSASRPAPAKSPAGTQQQQPQQQPTRRGGSVSGSPVNTTGANAANSSADKHAVEAASGAGGTPSKKLRRLPETKKDAALTADDAAEGTEAFRNRISEITSFRVVSRVRPFIAEELADMQGQERRSVVEMAGNTTILLDPAHGWAPKAQYEFDAALWSIPPSHELVHTFSDTKRQAFASQKDVYEIIAKDLVPHVFGGFNSCILSYGQTGSGKTYTMMGHYDPTAECGGDGEEGIIPRVSNDLFALLAERRREQDEKGDALGPEERATFRVEVSFVEIYMEQVRDLLDPALRNSRGSEKLHAARIREDPQTGPYVEGVTRYEVADWTQCCRLLERGSQHRTTCATAVHNQSSRSHAIYTITLVREYTSPPKDKYSPPTVRTLSGRINLVDLAGSERGGFQDYVKESSAINTSLLALRRVIDNLTERQNILIEQAKAEITGAPNYYQDRALPQVPFRDSVLTWLLSDSFAGNARTTMVATLSPLVRNYGDTLATLQWSSKARNLVTLVRMNDQEVVQGGMRSRAGELGQTAQSQQQSLESLRETLRYKQVTAERLEKETKLMRVALEKTQQRRDAAARERAAVVIQRAARRRLHRHRLAECDAEKTKIIAAMTGKDSELQEIDGRRTQAEAAAAEVKKRLARVTQERDAVAKRVSAIEQNADAFEERRAAAAAEKTRVEQEMDADAIREEYRRQKADEAAAAAKELEVLKAQAAQREETIKERQAVIARNATEEYKQKAKADAADLEELRRKRDELKAKRDEAVRLRDATREEHAKLFKKKK